MDQSDADEATGASKPQHLAALVLTALPLLYLSVNFFTAWLHPLAPRNLPWVKDAALLIWLEFILAHAGVFALSFLGVGLHRRTVPGMLAFLAFYGMFIAGFSIAFGRAEMVLALGALLFGRLYSAAFAKHGSSSMRFVRSFLTIGVYMACMFVCTVFYGGWDAKTTRAVAKLLETRANPFFGQAAAACALYYLALAILEVKLFFSPPTQLLARLDAADAQERPQSGA